MPGGTTTAGLGEDLFVRSGSLVAFCLSALAPCRDDFGQAFSYIVYGHTT